MMCAIRLCVQIGMRNDRARETFVIATKVSFTGGLTHLPVAPELRARDDDIHSGNYSPSVGRIFMELQNIVNLLRFWRLFLVCQPWVQL